MRSISVLIAFHGTIDGQKDNAQVQPQTPVLHIPYVMLDPFAQLILFFNLTTEPIDLRPSRHAGFDKMADHIFSHDLRKGFRMQQHMRPGTYDGHITHKHIDELRQLVEIGFPEEFSKRGDAGIVLGDLFGVGVFVDGEAAKLKAAELFVVFSGTHLYEEYGAFRIQFNKDGQYGYQPGQQKDDDQQAEYDIEYSFLHAVGNIFQGFGAQGKDRQFIQVFHMCLAVDIELEIRDEPETDQGFFGRLGHFIDRGIPFGGDGGIDFIDIVLYGIGNAFVDIADNGKRGEFVDHFAVFEKAFHHQVSFLHREVVCQFPGYFIIADDDNLFSFLGRIHVKGAKQHGPGDEQDRAEAYKAQHDEKTGEGIVIEEDKDHHSQEEKHQAFDGPFSKPFEAGIASVDIERGAIRGDQPDHIGHYEEGEVSRPAAGGDAMHGIHEQQVYQVECQQVDTYEKGPEEVNVTAVHAMVYYVVIIMIERLRMTFSV